MTESERDQLLQNLDRRVAGIEQKLPTLATREGMHAAIQEAVAPLATRDEMYAAIKAEGAESRHHMDILVDSLRDDVRSVAEGQVVLGQRLTSLDARVAALEGRR